MVPFLSEAGRRFRGKVEPVFRSIFFELTPRDIWADGGGDAAPAAKRRCANQRARGPGTPKSTRLVKIDFRVFSRAHLVTLLSRMWRLRVKEFKGQVRAQVTFNLYWRSSDSDDLVVHIRGLEADGLLLLCSRGRPTL